MVLVSKPSELRQKFTGVLHTARRFHKHDCVIDKALPNGCRLARSMRVSRQDRRINSGINRCAEIAMQGDLAEGFVLREQDGGQFILGIAPKQRVGGAIPEEFAYFTRLAALLGRVDAHGQVDAKPHLTFVGDEQERSLVAGSCWLVVRRRSVSGRRMVTPSRVPPLNSIRAKRE